MAKKNLGPVKRYKHPFYTTRQRVIRVVKTVAAIAALFVVGYLVGPAVIDLGTGAWYSLRDGGGSGGVPAVSEPAVSSQAAAQSQAAEPEPTATPEPTPAPVVQSGNWSFVSLGSLGSRESMQAAAQSLAEQGVQYAVVPLKDSTGYLYYNSGVQAASGSVAATTIDPALAAEVFAEAGLTPVASLYVFQDPLSPYTQREMGIHYQDSEYFWLDAAQNAGGKPWLDPYSDQALTYINSLLDEVRGMGYQTILLSAVQFPSSATENCGYSGGAAASAERLAALIADWQTSFAEAGDTLWVQYPLSTVASTETVTALAGTFGQLGVENLVVSLPAEPTDDLEDQLAAASANIEAAGTANVVIRSGDSASFG